jgi:hypothetical protein
LRNPPVKGKIVDEAMGAPFDMMPTIRKDIFRPQVVQRDRSHGDAI